MKSTTWKNVWTWGCGITPSATQKASQVLYITVGYQHATEKTVTERSPSRRSMAGRWNNRGRQRRASPLTRCPRRPLWRFRGPVEEDVGGRQGKVRLCGDDRSEAQGAEQPVIVMKRLKGRGAKGLRRSTHNFAVLAPLPGRSVS